MLFSFRFFVLPSQQAKYQKSFENPSRIGTENVLLSRYSQNTERRVEMESPFSASCILFNHHINIVWWGMQKICCGIGWRDHTNAWCVCHVSVQQGFFCMRTRKQGLMYFT